MGVSVKTISIIVAANIKGLEKGMGKANKSLAKFASGAARMGSLLTFSVTGPLAALGKSAMDTFVQFENGMAKVGTVTNATTDELKMLTSEAKRLGSTTQFTASQVAELQLSLGRKGFDPEAIKNMEQSVLDLSLATGEDLTLAADVVGASIRAFGKDSSEAASVANTLALASANSSIKLSTFSTAFANAGASASAVGVDLEELSAMMGVLMDSGIKASKAGTGLNSLFIKLKEKGISLSDTLDMLSEGQMGLDRATAIVGKNFSKQLLILSKNRDKTKELTKEYKNNTTGLDDMAKKMGQTTQAKIKRMSSAIEGLQLEFGALIADALTPLINKITELASNFTNLDDETKNTILTVAGIAGAIGPVLLVIASLTSSFGMLFTAIKNVVKIGFAMFTNPIGIIIGLVGVLAAGVVYLAGNWNAFLISVAKSSRGVNGIIKGLLKGLGSVLGPTSALYIEMQAAIGTIEALEKNLDDIDPDDAKFKTFGETIKDVVSDLSGLDLDAFDKLFDLSGGKPTTAPTPTEGDNDKQQFVKSPFDFSEEYEQYLIQLESARVKTQEWSNAMNQYGLTIATSFADSFASVLVSGGNLLEGLGQIFVDLGKQIAAMVIKAAVLAALLSITGLGGTAMASGGIFSKGSGFSNILQGLMGGAFANGGQPPVGKMSLVGERGPELFVPGSSGTIIPNHALGGGGTVIPDVRITGDDLLIVFDRANRRKERR